MDKINFLENILKNLPATDREAPLMASWLETPLGPMLAIGNEKLYLLEFRDTLKLKEEILRMHQKTGLSIKFGRSTAIESIEKELQLYFKNQLQEFKTPLCFLGSSFQQLVWKQLMQIPFGKTRSYLDMALSLDKPTAFRAVAQANASNQLAVIVPCHRVINHNGKLGGYAGGLDKKEWLLEHEKESN